MSISESCIDLDQGNLAFALLLASGGVGDGGCRNEAIRESMFGGNSERAVIGFPIIFGDHVQMPFSRSKDAFLSGDFHMCVVHAVVEALE